VHEAHRLRQWLQNGYMPCRLMFKALFHPHDMVHPRPLANILDVLFQDRPATDLRDELMELVFPKRFRERYCP